MTVKILIFDCFVIYGILLGNYQFYCKASYLKDDSDITKII